ncbi:MAG: hypothetical protein RJA55_2314 [Acidobacteriota bacterium]
MAGLLDFLQSASNAAASNVSAPVDVIAWILGKAGFPVQEPVGGSDWMKRQGLTRDVPQSAAADYAQGSLYKVYLPDEKIARMLDWDKPLSQQAPEVIDAARKAFPPSYVDGRFVDPFASGKTGRALLDELGAIANKRGAPGMRMAEPAMRAAGIPGIRYLDGGSRGAGQGTSNYVVFPGEEALLRILERNGNPL